MEKLWIYDYKTTMVMLVLLCIIAIILLILIIHYLYHMKSTTQHKKEKNNENKEPTTELSVEEHIFEDEILKYLKEDERVIARILKQRDGSCEQATLRLVSGFSKAKLSRLLTDMDERGVIKKEHKGKKNIVYLRSL